MESGHPDREKAAEILSESVKLTEIHAENGADGDKAANNNQAVKPMNNSGIDAENVKITETHTGHGVQVVTVTETHSYELEEHALQEILMKEEIKDLPVVVVSIAGATRTGKSYLLNFFLRYLTAPEIARENGSWMGEDSAPLVGFKWRSGSKRTTLGILFWSEPFILKQPSGEKVAVLLVDTQGTFDSTSTVNDCSTIFALSTLLSSVQIYNISLNIQEDNLQFLQLFTDYGRMLKDQDSKAFQVLEFLVRDWQYSWEYPYGAVGGEQLLEEKLKITPTQTEGMQEMRKNIRSSFEKVSCFLMPHPGFKIFDPQRKGNISDISIEFRTYVKELVTSLFSSEKLMPKTINGEKVKARELFNYFKAYMTVIKSDKMPSLTSIIEATENANLLSILNEASEAYKTGMNSVCGPNQLSMPPVDVHIMHLRYSDLTLEKFSYKKKMGSKEKNDKYLNKLIMDLEKWLPQFVQNNLVKTQILINKANDSYKEAVQNFVNLDTVCVHPLDLGKILKAGHDAAVRTFDEGRKRITKRNDEERVQFIKSLERWSTLLEQTNQKNNNMAVSQLCLKYKQHMTGLISSTNLLSVEEFENEHNNAERQAMEDFKVTRNIPSAYTEDAYVDKIKKEINDNFIMFTDLNNKRNKLAIDAAVNEFDSCIQKYLWDSKYVCWHPVHLENKLSLGMDLAFRKLFPNDTDQHRKSQRIHKTLDNILVTRKNEIIQTNNSCNDKLVNEGFDNYESIMMDYYTSWFTSKWTYYERAKEYAIKWFYRGRTDRSDWREQDSDHFYQRMMNSISRNFEKYYE